MREASVFNFLVLIKLTDSSWQFNGDLSEVLKTKRNDMSYCWSYCKGREIFYLKRQGQCDIPQLMNQLFASDSIVWNLNYVFL